MVHITPILLGTALTLAPLTQAAKGINCNGSWGCMKFCKLDQLTRLEGMLQESINKGMGHAYYAPHQFIACDSAGPGACCAFYQNGASGNQHLALSKIQDLKSHGCKTCGSCPTEDGNKLKDGMVTVNYIAHYKWACGGEDKSKSGVCYYNGEEARASKQKTITMTKKHKTITQSGTSTFTRSAERDMTTTVMVDGLTVTVPATVLTVPANGASYNSGKVTAKQTNKAEKDKEDKDGEEEMQVLVATALPELTTFQTLQSFIALYNTTSGFSTPL